MAFAPALLRTNTAPVFPASSSSAHSTATTMSQMRASHLSGSTVYNSASSASLNSLGGSTINGGPVQANANIINQKADASRSLYQICVALRLRLARVPGFQETYLADYDPINDEDPVEFLWNLLRTGHPLVHTYNSLGLGKSIEIPAGGADPKRSKIAVFKFAEACLNVLKIHECFVINDLLGNDTTGLVKVTNVVNAVLDLGEQNGVLYSVQAGQDDSGPAPAGLVTVRDHILKELVNTERKYVQDLENLHDLKKTLEQKGVIPGDIVHQIFLNINAILDFQRRFLIRVETTNSLSPAQQRWGAPFVNYEEAFNIYHPFIANQRKAAQTANQVMDKIRLAEHPVACDFNTLDGFLLKPMQRLVKYPLLLKELLKKGSGDDPEVKMDLSMGIESAERVLSKANEAVDRDLLDEALEELITRVDDWKNHRVEQFGRLLQHGVHTVVTGRSEQEKEYEIYLFECILLCCKEIIPNKDKSKKDKTKSAPRTRNKNNKLQLKGRIFMTNVTEVLSFAKPGSYTVQIWWKGDPGVENFVVKFANEETMKKWASGLDQQRKENAPAAVASPDQPNPEFAWMRNVNNIENPYAQQDDDDEDEDPNQPVFTAPNYNSTGGVMQRNASSTNLRTRSTTVESTQSLAGMIRAPPPRFPLPPPPTNLTLQTANGAHSPGPRGGESYFSPTAESPASSRTSTASNMFGNNQYPFPRTSTPQTGWEDNNRYTAPAAPRASSRDGSSPANGYGKNPRSSQQQSIAQQQRSRSYSTPDIAAQQGRRTNSNTPVPAVPGIPSHLHPAHDSSIPRSQTGSPRQEIPIRSNTQSPGVQRERMNSTAGYGGTMSHFPSQPVHRSQGSQSLQPISISNQTSVPPPLASAPPNGLLSSPDLPIPTQLKVKVNCDSGNYVTLVVAFNITYQSLIDRIDAKLARFTNSSIGRGNLRLKYADEDGDHVTIESDDDIQIAFLEWREGVRNMYSGGVGEIELFCVGDMN